MARQVNVIYRFIVFVILICLSTSCSKPSAPVPNQTTAPKSPVAAETPVGSASPHTVVEYGPEDIKTLWIILKIEGKDSLFVLLGRDGSVNRQGTGIDGEEETLFYIGQHPGLFEPVIANLDRELLKQMGGYQSTPIKGAVCELQVNLEFQDGVNGGFGWKYGLESEGPPNELRDLVIKAIESTQPMYDEALAKQGKSAE